MSVEDKERLASEVNMSDVPIVEYATSEEKFSEVLVLEIKLSGSLLSTMSDVE